MKNRFNRDYPYVGNSEIERIKLFNSFGVRFGCGSEKQQSSGQTTVNQTTTPTATAEETAMNKARLEQFYKYEPGQTEMYKNSFALGNQLLTSFQNPSSEQWQSLIGGVTQSQMNAQAGQAVNTSNSYLNQAGIMDSGAGQVARARAAADSYNTNAQFNVGALQNALNLAFSGQAQVQSPANSNTSSLASSLAGLRSTNTSGTTSTNQNSIYTPSMLSQMGQGMSGVGGLMYGFGNTKWGK